MQLLIACWFFCFAAAPADAQVTSENNSRLKKALKQNPAADTNGDGVLTKKEALAFRDGDKSDPKGGTTRRKKPAVSLDHADVVYGPHPRNVLDLWIADSESPTPLLICIHGGGFANGDKSKYHKSGIVKSILDNGVSVATINYRLTEGGRNPYPAPMHDAARALQFLRSQSKQYNLDKTRVAAMGDSAGGTIALWLGFHDDLANPKSDDPILRESTRLTACAPNRAQPSAHLPTVAKWFGVESLIEHKGLRPLFAASAGESISGNARINRLSLDASPVTHLTPDDVPVFFTAGEYVDVSKDMGPGSWVHHPLMGIRLKEMMDKLNVECHMKYPGGPTVNTYSDEAEFLLRKLKSRPHAATFNTTTRTR